MKTAPCAAGPQPDPAAPAGAAGASAPIADPGRGWEIHAGVRVTKRTKVHILLRPDGQTAIYAKTLHEVFTHLYEQGVTDFAIIEDQNLWKLRLSGPPTEAPD